MAWRTKSPIRGEIWLVEYSPVRGHEEGGLRPGVIISSNVHNSGPAQKVVSIPISTVFKGVRWHVPVNPPEGGLKAPSFILCDDLRATSYKRLKEQWGQLAQATIASVEDRLRMLLGLP